MSLLKVIMTSATVATTLFTGVAPDAPDADFPVGQYAAAPEADQAVVADSEIYDAVRAALSESFGSGESVLARHFWNADVLTGKAGVTLPERTILAKKQAVLGKDAANAGNETKTAGIGGSRGQESAVSAGTPVNHNSAETMVANAADKTNEPALYGNADTLANTPENKETSPAADAGNVSEDTGGNEPAPAPVVPNASTVNPTVAAGSSEPAPAPAVLTPEPAVNPADAGGSEEPAPAPVVTADNRPKYDHTTSIYTNDESTLLRVEYYDENNKLFEYSSVESYDKDTNSYTETVYRWDDESDSQVTVRTDTYVNGELTSSNTP